MNDFKTLREIAAKKGPKRLAVVVADDEVALSAALEAMQLDIALPVLIGEKTKIISILKNLPADYRLSNLEFVEENSVEAAARKAVEMARSGRVDILLKGHLRTDQLLHAVLDKKNGLRTGSLLSDVLIYEDVLSGERRFVGVTDGGLNVLPSLEQKIRIIKNALRVFRRLGFAKPRIAIMSATEAVTEAMPSTIDAQKITTMAESGEFGDCEIFGPLALDNALLTSAAKAKGISSPVAGFADVLVMPNIEAGNILGKAVKYIGGSQCAHVIMGATVPILIPSRVESIDDKLNSIALGALCCGQ